MDTEEDPAGAFDMIFERLRDDSDESGRSGMTHATFGALVAGVQPAIPPPWERDRFNGSADELFDQRFGTMLGQSRDSAGRVEYLTLPRLVRGLAQVNEVAAGGGFTLAVRKACRPGSYLDPTSGDCGLCPAGHYSDELSTLECKPCPRGQAATTAGSSRCTPCEPGYYASDLGTEECSACPAGTFVGFGGAASADQCVPCSPWDLRGRAWRRHVHRVRPGNVPGAVLADCVCPLPGFDVPAGRSVAIAVRLSVVSRGHVRGGRRRGCVRPVRGWNVHRRPG